VTSRVLVTGGAGFIGSYLVDELVARGDDVVVLDKLEPQVHKHKPDYLNPKARYHTKDVRDENILKELVPDADVVIHLAAMVGVGQSMYQVTRYVDANVGGTAQLLQSLVDVNHSVKRFIVASSMSIYGEGAYQCPACGPVSPSLRSEKQLAKKEWEVLCPNCGKISNPVPTPETKPLQANSVYAVTKRDQEDLCHALGRAYGVPTVALRFFNVYGPRQSLDNPYTGVAAIFQSRIKNGQPPVIFEDGGQTRDFVSVHDIVQSLVLAMEKHAAEHASVNVGSGKPVSILQVAEVLLKLHRGRARPSVNHKYRAGDVRHCIADITMAKQLLGYTPKVPFEEGMRELVDWGRMSEATDGFERAYAELRSKGLVEE
jgi:dTDP-L-rhamnose 4-epimerase